jgi:formate hydrogenlyase subunit 6/NADH:ubiquinone oxidoreductase subunit I
MDNQVIEKSAIAGFLDGLLETYCIFAPVEREGVLGFERLSSSDAIVLDARNTRQAPKEVFFPRSETLFTYQDGTVTPVPPVEETRVVLGIRPCDARSAILLDKVFDGPEYQDPYYVNRRRNTVLVGFACGDPLSTCFCTAVGGGPFSAEGLDLLWTDLGERYLVEAITERGEALISGHPQFCQATEEDTSQKATIAARADEMVTGPHVEGITERLDGMYDDPFWDELHQKCLGCAACSYLCPTCHCFDIVDEGIETGGRRVRNWDSCQFALFTLHGSGHNPRHSGKERMRQRVMHKFSYFVENFGEIACVGCGRCVRACPVNMDIRAVIEAIQHVGDVARMSDR